MEPNSPRPRVVSFVERAWPVALLLLATLWVYRPYAGSRLVSGNDDSDGLSYHSVVADALAQRRAGVFPAYVGQSAYRWNGGTYPQAQAPGLSLLAAAVDVATLSRLSSAGALNVVVLLCALAGALAMYLALRPLDSGRRWLAAAAALMYVCCPGVLGALVRLDMYTTFLVLPLLPILWRSLLAVLSGGSRRQAVALGLAAAALWSCHPPVALWATSVAAVTVLAFGPFARLTWRPLLLAAGVFLAAEAWHLTTLFSLGAEQVRDSGLRPTALRPLPPSSVQAILRSLRAEWPGALLPVGWVLGGRVNGWPVAAHEATFLPDSWRTRAGTPYLQLGYALWGALLLGLAAARRSGDRRAWAPAAGALVLLAFLVPWPLLNEFLWGHLPSFYGITRLWPMQRFYVLLASLAPFCAVPVLARLRPSWLSGLLVLVTGWSLLEAGKLSTLGLQARREPAATLAENAPLKSKDLQMSAPRLLPHFSDPALYLRLLPEAGEEPLADNLAALSRQLPAAWPVRALDTLTLAPGERQAVFFRAAPGVRLAAAGPGYWRHADASPLPLWTSEPQAKLVMLSAFLPRDRLRQPVELAVVPYRPEGLPLGLTNLVPLTVSLAEASSAGALETPRLYLPGYRASVDGRTAEVRPSGDGYVLVKLPAGAREVRLEYVGTRAMRATFWLSAIAWLLGLGAMAGSGRRS